MKDGFRMLVLVLYYIQVKSWKFGKYPYADLTMAQKIKHDGYPLKTYKIVTPDQYLLTISRIPYGRNSTNTTNRSPVLLLHGMQGHAEVFIVLGKYKSLAYYLADSGFDVWLLNNRGSPGSQGHLKYNLNTDPEYFEFGFQEIAIYDIPSTIDLIVQETKKKVFTIGHSQGATSLFITLSERPEYNTKVKMMVAYAPSIMIYYQNVPLNKIFIHLNQLLERIAAYLGLQELFLFSQQISEIFLKPLCREQTFFLELCIHIMSMIATHDSVLLDKDLVPVITSMPISRVSLKQPFHYLQIAKSGIFKKFDYGPVKNLKIYNQTTPPTYNIKQVTTPIALFFAEKDEYITKKSREEAGRMLENVVYQKVVNFKRFTHLDFIFGKNASSLVYEPTVKMLKEFDKHNGTL